jgi:hypothetical protein
VTTVNEPGHTYLFGYTTAHPFFAPKGAPLTNNIII